MYVPSLAEVVKLAGEYNLIPVYREIVADLETPVSAYLKIAGSPNSFLLESVEGGDRIARYSYIGTRPYKVLKTYLTDSESPLAKVAAELNRYKIAPVEGVTRFGGGAVGYLGYEAVTRFEELPSPVKDPLQLPEAIFLFTDSLLIFDHVTHRIKAMSYVHTGGDLQKSYRQATNKIEELISRLNQPLPPAPMAAGSTGKKSEVVSNLSRPEFARRVSKIKDYISAGEAIQVVLSQRLSRSTSVPPFDIYRALRTINPSPYMFYLDFGDFQVIGTSPEILVRVEDGSVMTRPLAGTRRRGKDPREDAVLENELRHDEKERAEHIMLVDLGRNDIGKVSQAGSVGVSDLMDVEKYSHVMHLVTHVQGKLQAGLNAFDALQSCFPAGTVSGAPKIRAMEIIAEMEPEKRGVYAGAAGYFSYSGNMDMAIAIRTMVVKNGTAYVQAGCGVVYDSQPEREYEESLNKAMALLKALDQAEFESGRQHAVTH